MKNTAVTIFLIALLVSGCEWRTFEFTANINVNENIEVDENGPFTTSFTITRAEVLDGLDIPESAEITKVEIESLVAFVTNLDDNEAWTLDLEGYSNLNQTGKPMFSETNVPVAAPNTPFAGLNSILANKIESNNLKEKLKAYLEGNDNSNLVISLNGNPGNNRLHSIITIRITGTAVYEECLEVLPGMGGELCDGT